MDLQLNWTRWKSSSEIWQSKSPPLNWCIRLLSYSHQMRSLAALYIIILQLCKKILHFIIFLYIYGNLTNNNGNFTFIGRNISLEFQGFWRIFHVTGFFCFYAGLDRWAKIKNKYGTLWFLKLKAHAHAVLWSNCGIQSFLTWTVALKRLIVLLYSKELEKEILSICFQAKL